VLEEAMLVHGLERQKTCYSSIHLSRHLTGHFYCSQYVMRT